MSAFPDGYTCGQCGEFVGWNTGHECAGMSIARGIAKPGAKANPIVVVLERIAVALEARPDGP